MFKLVLRFIIVAIILTVLTGLVLDKLYKDLRFYSICENTKSQQTTLNLLNNYLKQFPVADWQTKLKQLVPYDRAINILPVNQVVMNSAQRKKLMRGQWICLQDRFDNPFGAAYMLSSNKHYVYRVYNGLNNPQTARFKIGVFQALLVEGFKQLPKQSWNQFLQQVSHQSGLPIYLKKLKQLKLNKRDQHDLQQYHWATPQENLAYGWLPNLGMVIQYGPYLGGHTAAYPIQVSFIYIIILAELLALLIAFLFIVSLRRLTRLADLYSQGKFSANVGPNRFSILYPLYCHLKAMGKRIADLMRANKDLSNSVAHELRTPLSRLRFSIDKLEHTQQLKDIPIIAQSMTEDIDELEALVSEMLAYAQLDRQMSIGELKPVALIETVKLLSEKLKVTAPEKTINLRVGILTDVIVNVEQKLLQRLLQNLLTNALRFAKTMVQVRISKTGKGYQLIIEDDGPGIPIDDREKVFEPFIQLANQHSPVKQGYGFGLAIVKKIVDRYGWTISVNDSALGGAQFVLVIT